MLNFSISTLHTVKSAKLFIGCHAVDSDATAVVQALLAVLQMLESVSDVSGMKILTYEVVSGNCLPLLLSPPLYRGYSVYTFLPSGRWRQDGHRHVRVDSGGRFHGDVDDDDDSSLRWSVAPWP